MDILPCLLFLIVGVSIGATCAWLVGRDRTARAIDSALAASAAERMRIETLLEAEQKRAAALSSELAERGARIALLQQEREQEIARRSAAEEHVKRIPEFEAMVSDLNARLETAYAKLLALETSNVQLSTSLDKEREAAGEKLRLLDEARGQLSDAFSALCSDALRSNNQSFLDERIAVMGEHLAKLGKSLGGAVDAYNRTVGSVESRVLVSAREFKKLSVTSARVAELEGLLPVDHSPRALSAPELTLAPAPIVADELASLEMAARQN